MIAVRVMIMIREKRVMLKGGVVHTPVHVHVPGLDARAGIRMHLPARVDLNRTDLGGNLL